MCTKNSFKMASVNHSKEYACKKCVKVCLWLPSTLIYIPKVFLLYSQAGLSDKIISYKMKVAETDGPSRPKYWAM